MSEDHWTLANFIVANVWITTAHITEGPKQTLALSFAGFFLFVFFLGLLGKWLSNKEAKMQRELQERRQREQQRRRLNQPHIPNP